MSQKLVIKVDDYNDIGEGVYRIGKSHFSLPYILKGEEVLIETQKNFSLNAKLIKILKESKDRVEPSCKVYKKCGSCQLLHMNYKSQIEFKKNYVLKCFKEQKLQVKIEEFIEAKKKTRYRNKMQVAFKNIDGKICYGFYEENSHKIIQINDCLSQSEKQNKILSSCAEIIASMKMPLYNEDRRQGLIRFIILKEAFETGELMVVVVTNSQVFPGSSEFVRRLIKKEPSITTIVQNINKRKTSIILGDEEKILYGRGFIEEKLGFMKFRFTSKSFFQVNPSQTLELYKKVVEVGNFKKDEIIMDAYSGVGTIGMFISPFVKTVISVEKNKQAVKAAIENAKLNNITNIRFYQDDATDFIDKIVGRLKINTVIIDPPRTGSTEKFLLSLCKIRPEKIIYVSCEAKTLARDCKILNQFYNIDKTTLVDMFVGTHHVETVVKLASKTYPG